LIGDGKPDLKDDLLYKCIGDDSYSMLRKLGEGAFAKVFHVIPKSTSQSTSQHGQVVKVCINFLLPFSFCSFFVFQSVLAVHICCLLRRFSCRFVATMLATVGLLLVCLSVSLSVCLSEARRHQQHKIGKNIPAGRIME